MAATGDTRIEAVLRAALRERPLDVVDLARAMRAAEPGMLKGREGAIHALLRRGLMTARLHAVGRSERGLSLYALTPDPVPTPAGLPPVAEGGVATSASKIALRVAEGVRDPEDHGRVVADVLAHLADLEAGEGVAAFGSPRAAAHLVRRAAAGRPTVAFPSTAGDHLRRFVVHEGPWIVGAVAAFFLLRAFVVGVYVIPSSSMEPTLNVGDRVVVWKPGGRSVPDRWEIVTFERKGTTYVKRVAGLPGEKIAIVHGEVWIDGKIVYKPDALRRELRAPYAAFDFSAGVAPVGWTSDGEGGGVSYRFGGSLPAHGEPQLEEPLTGTFELRDAYLDLDVERPADGAAVLTLGRRDRAGSTKDVRWSLAVTSEGTTLSREGAPLAPSAPRAPAGRLRLSLSLVDGVLRARAGDFVFEGPVEAPDLPIAIGVAAGGGTRLRSLALDRDHHYSYVHSLAVPDAFGSQDPTQYAYPIPPDALFLLGDNTTNSSDSRNAAMGPVRLAELIGPVSVRIWPPGRLGGVR